MPKKGRWKGTNYEGGNEWGRARRAFDIEWSEVSCTESYEAQLFDSIEATTEGLLLLAKVTSKTERPDFWIRWDEKANQFDVDMYGDDRHLRDWTSSTNGYSGHQSRALSAPAAFLVSIAVPNLSVFRGVVKFSLEKSRGLQEEVSVQDDGLVVKNPPDPK